MRAIFIFLLLNIFLISCVSVEVAKEVTKATQSIETSMKRIFKPSKEENTENRNENIEDEGIKNKIISEKKEILEEKAKVNKLISKQKKISSFDITKKTLNELNNLIGNPKLTRIDGKTKIIRYDSDNCRLFIFLNSKNENSLIQYYELRNTNGNLIELKNEIEKCFVEIKLI